MVSLLVTVERVAHPASSIAESISAGGIAHLARGGFGRLPLSLDMAYSIEKGFGVEKQDDDAHRRHGERAVAHRADRHQPERRDRAGEHQAGDADPADEAVPEISEDEGEHG